MLKFSAKVFFNIKCSTCGVGYRKKKIENAYYCGACKRYTFTGFVLPRRLK